VFNGAGRIDGPGRVVVSGAAGDQVLETKNIVIATGSEPTPLVGVDIDEERVVSSTGAPVAGCRAEAHDRDRRRHHRPRTRLGLAPPRRGSDRGRIPRPHPAPALDGEVAKQPSSASSKQGIEFKLGMKVTGVEKLKSKLEALDAAGRRRRR
jgi:dihydrolipoamide dehydrogenase